MARLTTKARSRLNREAREGAKVMIKIRSQALVVLCAASTGLSAQAPRPTFDVASIKKIDQAPTLSGFPAPAIRGGTLTLLSTNVAALIQTAYGVRDFQVVEGPDWVRKDLFEVHAKAA